MRDITDDVHDLREEIKYLKETMEENERTLNALIDVLGYRKTYDSNVKLEKAK